MKFLKSEVQNYLIYWLGYNILGVVLFFKPSKKYNVSKRKIIYQSKIHFTPLKNNSEIDIETLSKLLIKDYKDAKIEIGDIDTGAVIITGESSKKNNAEEIVKKIALSSGKFVAASAGPNFETIIAAQGSGAVEYSQKNECYLIHCDIGGGTSKIAFIKRGANWKSNKRKYYLLV